LRLCALIAPDEGGPNHFIVRIEQYCPMHLSGKADTTDPIFAGSQSVKSAMDRDAAGPPPIARILFGPSRLRRGEGNVLFRT
jgi:hypothetical protein